VTGGPGLVERGLAGKVAVVTGASRGLGRATATALSEAGVRVLASARSGPELEALAATAPERVRAAPCDLRDPAAAEHLVDRALDAFGRLDIVVNDAAVSARGRFLAQSPEAWREAFDVNVLAPFHLCAAAGRHLVAQGSGKIVNIASTAALRGAAGLVAYTATKGALVQFTAALAAELAPDGVQVNAIAPGAFATAMQEGVTSSPDRLAARLARIPAGRMGRPEELADLVCYLASSASDFVTGSVFVIDGGEAAHL